MEYGNSNFFIFFVGFVEVFFNLFYDLNFIYNFCSYDENVISVDNRTYSRGRLKIMTFINATVNKEDFIRTTAKEDNFLGTTANKDNVIRATDNIESFISARATKNNFIKATANKDYSYWLTAEDLKLLAQCPEFFLPDEITSFEVRINNMFHLILL